MKIAIAGGTGFIGSKLVQYLGRQHDHVILISRKKGHQDEGIEHVTWDELTEKTDRLEGLDAIVNLSGESINQRWTEKAKHRIVQSRLDTTSAVVRLVNRLKNKPQAVINASGISIYGTSESDTFDESCSPRIEDFLSDTVVKWEKAIDAIEDAGVRVVKVRVGLVLGKDGGAYPKMSLPYKLGIGGKVGSGRQWLSWIHIDDMVGLIEFCITHKSISGPVNAAAPNPVTNDQFGRALGRAMGRPHWLPVPAFMMKLLFGELSILLLKGQKVLPKVLLQNGYEYRYPTIDAALKQLERPE